MAGSIQHALLGIACLALFGAGHRLAARMSDRLSDRLLAALVLSAAAAVAEALLVGLAVRVYGRFSGAKPTK